jgi:hypothetical protein
MELSGYVIPLRDVSPASLTVRAHSSQDATVQYDAGVLMAATLRSNTFDYSI